MSFDANAATPSSMTAATLPTTSTTLSAPLDSMLFLKTTSTQSVLPAQAAHSTTMLTALVFAKITPSALPTTSTLTVIPTPLLAPASPTSAPAPTAPPKPPIEL
jgi:hypothetical protein